MPLKTSYKPTFRSCWMLATCVTLALCPAGRAAEPSSPPAPAGASTNRLLRATNSAERQKMFEEWRKTHPAEAAQMDKVRNMTPEQREAARKAWAEKQAGQPTDAGSGTVRQRNPQQRQERMNRLRARFEEREAELKKKETAGTLTAEERKTLEQTRSYLKQMQNLQEPAAPPAPSPAPPAAPKKKP